MKKFEYRVCQVQNNYITFVNGIWQGKVKPDSKQPEKSLNSCPQVWDYLSLVGEDGWELVTSTGDLSNIQMLYLKKENRLFTY